MLYVVVEELIPEIGLYGGGIFSAGEKRGILNAMNRNGSKKDEDCEMNIEERAAQAAAWKAAGQCNCAQAVLKAFEDKLPVDADTLMSWAQAMPPVWAVWKALAVHSSAQ